MTVTYIEEKVTQYANMVTHWTFDEPGGNRIKDYGPLYPNGHDIEKIGGNSRTTSGKFGGGLQINANQTTNLPPAAHPPPDALATSISFGSMVLPTYGARILLFLIQMATAAGF